MKRAIEILGWAWLVTFFISFVYYQLKRVLREGK